MKRTGFAALVAILLWGAAPAFAGPPGCVGPDNDGDLIDDCADNCSDDPNGLQVDIDGDLCGNVCDTDWSQNGLVGFEDFGQWAIAFGTTDPNFKVAEPNTGVVGFPDFGAWAVFFGGPPGPSGTTTGTTACP